ncbi:DOMON-like domain-containing protein [Sphingomonas montanisoli]|uniref:DOMON-like domain-containing protein n=2 Tax=Sphingomonas montanisoli TaxID=2606412 RepID=A0A5D9C1R5_9SPHN|nr:DOMON-like domain-containing protein [Sphingomonas montanisoli]
MLLTYRVIGARPMRPEWAVAERADGLWQTTCFEAFIRPGDGHSYFEFNFSPSTRWAAYAFDRYREGMRNLALPVEPFIERTDDGVEVDLDLSVIPYLPCVMSVSAIIEEKDGTKSYWALAHPPGKPDFHDPACFVLELPAPRLP